MKLALAALFPNFAQTLTPGSLITLFGAQLAGVTAIEAGGQPIALLSVSADQLNARLPLRAPGPVELRLRTPAALSPPTTITLQPAAPSSFLASTDPSSTPTIRPNPTRSSSPSSPDSPKSRRSVSL